ncbi:MAG: D-alanine--D-alanine ligase [Candidatus Nanopelagicales bacterium]
MHILVLSGGLSPERDVSLRSGRRLANALREALPDSEISESDVTAETLQAISLDKPDCVIPVIHGAVGEDGSLRNVLESLGIPFVGSGAQAARLAFDKGVANSLVPQENVPKFVVLPQSFFRELGANSVIDAIVGAMKFPIVVKPLTGGSALGVTLCSTRDDIPTAMVAAFGYDDHVMIQEAVSGTELAVTVVEHGDEAAALPPVEIVPVNGMYDYHSRYTAGHTEFFAPARLTASDTQRVNDFAMGVHKVLGLRDVSRTDLILDSEGKIWFIEVNVAPGMTETSLVPMAISAAGLSVGQVFGELAFAATRR